MSQGKPASTSSTPASVLLRVVENMSQQRRDQYMVRVEDMMVRTLEKERKRLLAEMNTAVATRDKRIFDLLSGYNNTFPVSLTVSGKQEAVSQISGSPNTTTTTNTTTGTNTTTATSTLAHGGNIGSVGSQATAVRTIPGQFHPLSRQNAIMLDSEDGAGGDSGTAPYPLSSTLAAAKSSQENHNPLCSGQKKELPQSHASRVAAGCAAVDTAPSCPTLTQADTLLESDGDDDGGSGSVQLVSSSEAATPQGLDNVIQHPLPAPETSSDTGLTQTSSVAPQTCLGTLTYKKTDPSLAAFAQTLDFPKAAIPNTSDKSTRYLVSGHPYANHPLHPGGPSPQQMPPAWLWETVNQAQNNKAVRLQRLLMTLQDEVQSAWTLPEDEARITAAEKEWQTLTNETTSAPAALADMIARLHTCLDIAYEQQGSLPLSDSAIGFDPSSAKQFERLACLESYLVSGGGTDSALLNVINAVKAQIMTWLFGLVINTYMIYTWSTAAAASPVTVTSDRTPQDTAAWPFDIALTRNALTSFYLPAVEERLRHVQLLQSFLACVQEPHWQINSLPWVLPTKESLRMPRSGVQNRAARLGDNIRVSINYRKNGAKLDQFLRENNFLAVLKQDMIPLGLVDQQTDTWLLCGVPKTSPAHTVFNVATSTPTASWNFHINTSDQPFIACRYWHGTYVVVESTLEENDVVSVSVPRTFFTFYRQLE